MPQNIVSCTASALTIRSLPTTEGATDTGRRMIRAQRAQMYGTSLDGQWIYVDAPAGRGWVARRYTEAVNEFVPSPAWPKVPNGLAEIKAVFGEAGRAICNAGRIHFPAALPLSWDASQKVKLVSCHKLLEDVLQSAFNEINKRGHWELLKDWGGCYNYRPSKLIQLEEPQPIVQIGLPMDRALSKLEMRELAHELHQLNAPLTAKLSTHAWGIGLDINVHENPLGKAPKMDARIVAIFRDHGFKWGGDWTRPDGMHFQYATGY